MRDIWSDKKGRELWAVKTVLVSVKNLWEKCQCEQAIKQNMTS